MTGTHIHRYIMGSLGTDIDWKIIDCEYEYWRHDAVMICIDSASNI